ncbi:MAG TPA: F0F1 ATP synthase subunit gamma [Candidatus Saccharimonadales bacterium]|nr:F0F1 ATP synthase subunit gamma [Candidatus Saccharimonadales bacterium]
MSRALRLQKELAQINTIEDLTQAFEGIASIHISHIRDRVVASKEFFSELWPVYSSLRVDPKERLRRTNREHKGRNVLVAVTGEGKLGTETAEKIIESMLATYSPDKTDIITVGSRGETLLRSRGVIVVNNFAFPPGDMNINIGSVIKELYKYDHISVFYQTYESLRQQNVQRIDLISAVRELGQDTGETSKAISSQDYIFEPNIDEIANYMESVMMGVAFIQIIMESKLAGYAARFNAMSRAKKRAADLAYDYKRQFYRSKRSESDERTKEIIKAAKIQELRR